MAIFEPVAQLDRALVFWEKRFVKIAFCQIFIIKTHKKRSKYSPFLCSPNQKVVRSTRLYDFLLFLNASRFFEPVAQLDRALVLEEKICQNCILSNLHYKDA